MARVRVERTNNLLDVDRLAKRCKGEFFGSWDGKLLFGFACPGHARLFVKASNKQGVKATIIA